MPVVSEEIPKTRRRNLWPPWAVAGSVLALLLAGMGLLPLANWGGWVAGHYLIVTVVARSPYPNGYNHRRTGRTTEYSVRIGDWHWIIRRTRF
jgi:hypothetical protein